MKVVEHTQLRAERRRVGTPGTSGALQSEPDGAGEGAKPRTHAWLRLLPPSIFPPSPDEPRLRLHADVLSLVLTSTEGSSGTARVRRADRHDPAAGISGDRDPAPQHKRLSRGFPHGSRGLFASHRSHDAATVERPIALFHEHPDWFCPEGCRGLKSANGRSQDAERVAVPSLVWCRYASAPCGTRIRSATATAG